MIIQSYNFESNLLVHVVYLRLVHETNNLSINTEVQNVVSANSCLDDKRTEVHFSKL